MGAGGPGVPLQWTRRPITIWSEKIARKRREREEYIQKIIGQVREKSADVGIEAQIEGRAKHLYSIHQKMLKQNKSIEQIYDLFAIRLIVAP
jgi:GTP pyrophosphokinase